MENFDMKILIDIASFIVPGYITLQISDAIKPKKQVEKTNEIHLEVISNKNPNAPERNRNLTTTNRRKNVTIEVGEIKNHGLSTIKEMVHKVNEL